MAVPKVRKAPRLTRPERKERTRTDLVAAARRVFERHGFHRASLEQIAEEAGYTKGAVYSNFAGKDELFLAVLDEHIAERVPVYSEIIRGQRTFEGALRSIARHLVALGEEDPAWTPLLVEFWTHASGREPLRRAVRERHDRQMQAVGAALDDLAARHGMAYRLPTPEFVRGSAALARGMGLERLVDPGALRGEVFEEMFVALCMGLARPAPERAPRVRKEKS
jgi:AcrR family transcriptional regulator